MFNSFIFFAILGIIWFFLVINSAQKRASRTKGSIGDSFSWGKDNCHCGLPRSKWKAIAMNRPEHLVLLQCFQCGEHWEEKLSVYGSKWRPVELAYAQKRYQLDEQDGQLPHG